MLLVNSLIMVFFFCIFCIVMALEECYAHWTASQKVQRLGPTILQVALLSQCLQSEEKVEGESEEGWTSGGGTLLVTFLCC